MNIFARQPQGAYIFPIDLENGQYVRGTIILGGYKEKLRCGRIRLQKKVDYFNPSGPSRVEEVYLEFGENKYKLGERDIVGSVFHSSVSRIELYQLSSNRCNRKGTKMTNKLLAALKLTRDHRKLHKAGVYDNNGNLTDDGSELLLNFLAKKYETDLVALTKDFTQKNNRIGDSKED